MKVLISPSSFGEISSEPLDILKKNKYEIITNPFKRKLTEQEVIELAKDAIGIIAGLEPLNSKVLDQCPNLKCISRVGVGMENVDVEYAQKKGIIVTNTPDGPTRAVAELTLAMTLALLRRIPQADTNMKKGVWEKETGNLLTGKTIGVVGLGRIGKNVAQIFKSLGNPVIGYDPVVDNEWVKKYEVPIVPFNAIFKKADIITLHIPGSRDKKPVVTEEIIASIKPGSFFINISRGDVVDEQALAQALRTKTIAGAAIDVFLQEPYNGPLINLNNVVLTPHIGSYAKESKFRMEIDAVNNLINALSKN